MAFPPEFLDELRNRVSLPGIVGRRVKLTKKGREYSGLCPFHNEKSPSFTVNEDKGFFHCFGCGAHGDAIGFEMRANHTAFTEAVEKLAAELGLEVP
ncbi:MAG TPA: CHC2 zinc finger domain-containing protein, partial [Magnetospirillum sp.]|nr:CHC2 zinc finger domain-containing protein [Magnetospirillum sp.]